MCGGFHAKFQDSRMNNKKSTQHSDAKLRLGTFATVWSMTTRTVTTSGLFLPLMTGTSLRTTTEMIMSSLNSADDMFVEFNPLFWSFFTINKSISFLATIVSFHQIVSRHDIIWYHDVLLITEATFDQIHDIHYSHRHWLQHSNQIEHSNVILASWQGQLALTMTGTMSVGHSGH